MMHIRLHREGDWHCRLMGDEDNDLFSKADLYRRTSHMADSGQPTADWLTRMTMIMKSGLISQSHSV